jgi:hypothetical protein
MIWQSNRVKSALKSWTIRLLTIWILDLADSNVIDASEQQLEEQNSPMTVTEAGR